MRHLAGDHVHFIGEGDRDDHVRITRAGGLEHIGMRTKPYHRRHVERVPNPTDQLRALVNDRYIDPLGGKLACDTRSNLTATTDNRFHGIPPKSAA